MKDYYAILGVPKTAKPEEIKTSFRKLAKKYHPDLNPGDQQAEARFKEVNEAYAVLSDDGARAKYDLDCRQESEKRGQPRQAQARKAASRAPVNPNFDISKMAQGFESFFGFDPETGDITDESKLNANAPKQKNPLDMSDLFSKYMGFK